MSFPRESPKYNVVLAHESEKKRRQKETLLVPLRPEGPVLSKMAKPREETIVSLGDYTTLIEQLTAKNKGAHWFRGVGDANHELIPSLYRHKKITEISQLIELEFEILTRFKHRSLPYQNRVLNTNWEYLFFMQHFGVPTRLLDWSENSMVALYFAITSAESHNDRTSGAFTRDPRCMDSKY